MDGIGYGNWSSQTRRHTGVDLEDSYDSSSPPTYTSDPYGFDSDAGQGNRSKSYSMASSKKDAYDFHLGTEESYGDFSDSSPLPVSKPKMAKRLSTEDRMAEILKNNKKPVETSETEGGTGGEEEDDVYGSWKSSWNQLMEGVDVITSPAASMTQSIEPSPPPLHSRSKSHSSFKPKADLLNSSDSFDLSEADFEIGTHAARRSQEMLEDRRRKSMANFVSGSSEGAPKQKYSDSPDIHKKKSENKAHKAHFSTAGISSIDPNEEYSVDDENASDEKGIRKYGSVGGKSDGDLLKVLAETKETFRYPVSANSSGSTEPFSPNSATGPTPASKRRQKQMEMRRSISPTPGKSLDEKLKSMKLQNQASKKEDDHVEPEHDYEDDPNHTGDYSMDDFDEDSPQKLPNKDQRPSSYDGTSDVDTLPETVPSLSKYHSAPLPSRSLSKEEEETQRSMDEIKNRWASLTSVSQLFPTVEEGKEDEEKDESDSSGHEQKEEAPDTVLTNQPDDQNVENSLPPQPEKSNESTSFQSLVEGPPPPPTEDEPSDSSMVSASVNSQSALNRFKAAGNAIIASNRTAKPVMAKSVSESITTNKPIETPDQSGTVTRNSTNEVESVSTGTSGVETLAVAHDDDSKHHTQSEDVGRRVDDEDFEAKLNTMGNSAVQQNINGLHSSLSQQQEQHPHSYHSHHYSTQQPQYTTYPSQPPPPQFHPGYSSIEQFPWQNPHFQQPQNAYQLQQQIPYPHNYQNPSHFSQADPYVSLGGNVIQPDTRSSSMGRARPVGIEVDPAEFLQQYKKDESSRVTPSMSRPSEWTSSLSLVSPSVTELHAHIASIQSHTDATASDGKNKIAQDISLVKKKAMNKPRSISNYSRTRIGRTSSRTGGRKVLETSGIEGEDNPPEIDKKYLNKKEVDGPKWSAINRIEAGNSRLLKQFEELDREIRNMKASGVNKSSELKRPPSASKKGNPNYGGDTAPETHRKSSAEEVSGQSSVLKTSQSKIPKNIPTFNVLYGNELVNLKGLAEPPPPPPLSRQNSDNAQDNDALEAIKSIFRESVDREKLLLQREQSLDVRESLLKSTYYSKLEKESAPDPKPVINDEKLLKENEDLKAELYELRAAQRGGFRGQHKATNSIDGEEKDHNDEGSQEEKGDDSSGSNNAEEMKRNDSDSYIKIKRSDYEKLLRSNAELENVVSLYEKSNERMTSELSEKTQVIKAMKVDFFNQQEALVRETNLLKNKLQTASGNNTTNVNDTSQQHLMALPHSHVSSSKGGLELQGLLHKEALLQDLHEQVVRMGKSNQEKDKEIEKLTGKINELQREAIVMSKTLEQYSTMASKGKALVDAFYPPPAGANASPSSDEKNFLNPGRGTIRNTQSSRTNFLHWDSESGGDEVTDQEDTKKAIVVNEKLTVGLESDSELVTNLRQELYRVQVESLGTIATLRSRLAWFADNQKIIEGVEEEKKTLERTLESEREKSMLQDTSMSAGSKTKSSGQRSMADIRRIKELESALVACRESIQKRFPDSVANLLYANVVGSIPSGSDHDKSMSDTDSSALSQALKEKEKYRLEVETVTREGEQRVRSLRQEFEKMRIGFESTIQKLNADLGLPPVPFVNKFTPAVSAAGESDRGGRLSSPVRSFGQAKQRIEELEVELTRVRSFYTKKIESLQRKHQAQFSALRRGNTHNPTDSVDIDKGNHDAVHQAEKRELLGRISMLESEVLNTAEELGRVRALSANSSPQEQITEYKTLMLDHKRVNEELDEIKTENAKYRSDIRRMEREISGMDEQLSQIHKSKSPDRTSVGISSPVADSVQPTSLSGAANSTQQLKKELNNQTNKFMKMSEEWTASKSSMEKSIRDLKTEKETLQEKLSELQKTVFDKNGEVQHWQGEALRLEMMSKEAKTPQMKQFLAMEQQLGSLESRLARREQELARVVEESKASSHMERLRLQSIHDQEMREKDEQLLRFEGELEELVTALHQQQLQK